MVQPVIELKRVLQEECEIYEEILSLEERKGDVIMDLDGKLLESLSAQQESLLGKVELLENEREDHIENYRKMNKLDDCSKNLTLKEIVQSMDEDSSLQLLRYGMDLKNLLLKLKEKRDINEKLINDNMEFFNLLVAGMKSGSSIKAGYGSDGKEDHTVANPVIFNQTV